MQILYIQGAMRVNDILQHCLKNFDFMFPKTILKIFVLTRTESFKITWIPGKTFGLDFDFVLGLDWILDSKYFMDLNLKVPRIGTGFNNRN